MIVAVLRRLALVLSLVLVLSLAITQTAAPSTRSIDLRAIGRPTWKPVDCHLFSGRIGFPKAYEEYLNTLAAVLPEPNHALHPVLGIGPGAPHRPPYGSEIERGLAATGLHEGRVFRTREFSRGSGVFVGCMIVPRPGVRGSSPDFASGRIIPNELFPIHAQGIAYRNHEVFDAALLDFDVPALDSKLKPPFDVDGHSHFPLFVTTNDSFNPTVTDLRGFYRYDITMLDTDGRGWRLQARFVVVR